MELTVELWLMDRHLTHCEGGRALLVKGENLHLNTAADFVVVASSSSAFEPVCAHAVDGNLLLTIDCVTYKARHFLLTQQIFVQRFTPYVH